METMKSSIVLVSDYQDYYDDFFASDAQEASSNQIRYVRNKKDEIPRKSLYKTLQKHRLIAPEFGLVKDFILKLKRKQAVVVFSDETLHSGGEKQVMSYGDALKTNSNRFMAVFSNSDPDTTYRYLVVGKRAFYMKYTSKEHWDTTVNPTIEIEEVEPGQELPFIPFDVPIYTVDFTRYEDKKGSEWMVAIDVNKAPLLKGTGIEEILYPFEIKLLVEEWFEQQANNPSPKKSTQKPATSKKSTNQKKSKKKKRKK